MVLVLEVLVAVLLVQANALTALYLRQRLRVERAKDRRSESRPADIHNIRC